MNSTKYLAATAAIAVMTGAVWFFSSEKRGEVAPLLSGAASSVTQVTQTGASPAAQAPRAMTVEAMNPTPLDLQHMKVLDEVLVSKNDNDPRLDSEFRGLSPTSKRMMEDKYRSLAPERRNERGTIAFLVGREISSVEDVSFLGGILTESPCLSMGDCSREDKAPENDAMTDEHLHAETGTAVSLAYPQMVALHSIEGQIERAEKGAKLSYLNEIRRVVEDATRSPIPIVADKARALQNRLKGLNS